MGTVLRRMKNTPEDGGTMLDRSIVLILSEMGGGDYHQPSPMPAFLVGRGGGTVKPGRMLDAGNQPHNMLLLAVLQALGLTVNTVGDQDLCPAPLALL